MTTESKQWSEEESEDILRGLASIHKDLRRYGAPNTASTDRKSLAVVTCLADVQSEPINWLWPGRIALGKLTLIAGDPGLGKSLLTTYLAACISRGYPWPIDKSLAPLGDVLLLSAEDDAGDTIKPRLEASGADCTHVHILEAVWGEDDEGKRIFSIKNDIRALEDAISSLPNCRLLIIDPISAYLDGTDSNKNSDVRGLLAPIAEFASRSKIAVIAISHLNKNAGGNALYRTTGSLAFTAAARAVYVVTKDKDNPERRLFMPVKNNIAKDNTGLAYSVGSTANGQPIIEWELQPVLITADEALGPSDTNEERTDTDWAIGVLENILAKGPMSVADVQKETRQAGISQKSLRRAREKLGIEPKKAGFNAGWVWSLPQHEDAQKVEDAHSEDEGTLGYSGHLQDTSDGLNNF